METEHRHLVDPPKRVTGTALPTLPRLAPEENFGDPEPLTYRSFVDSGQVLAVSYAVSRCRSAQSLRGMRVRGAEGQRESGHPWARASQPTDVGVVG